MDSNKPTGDGVVVVDGVPVCVSRDATERVGVSVATLAGTHKGAALTPSSSVVMVFGPDGEPEMILPLHLLLDGEDRVGDLDNQVFRITVEHIPGIDASQIGSFFPTLSQLSEEQLADGETPVEKPSFMVE